MEYINKTKPKALILIGNGFDVAHGLKTKYRDFYERSEELKALAYKGNLLCQHILNNVNGDLWQDLECGLFDYSKELTNLYGNNDKESSERFRIEFYELRDCLFSYIRKAINNSPNNNPGYFIAKLSEEWRRLNYQIISFNYSYVVAAYTQKAIRNKRDFDFSTEDIIFQHGSLYDPEHERFDTANHIVLGIDDTQKVENNHAFLYKSTQNIHNINHFSQLLKEIDLYIIFGCSMGASDAFYFHEIFSNKHQNKTIIIYGYGREALVSLKEKIHEYSGELNEYKAETNNVVIFIDCSKYKRHQALTETKEAIDKVIRRHNQTDSSVFQKI